MCERETDSAGQNAQGDDEINGDNDDHQNHIWRYLSFIFFMDAIAQPPRSPAQADGLIFVLSISQDCIHECQERLPQL